MTRNPLHSKHGRDRPTQDVETRGLEARNEALGRAPEEPRDVRKAGGGTKGASQGGAHTGRYAAAPGKVTSDRERKPRGGDEAD